ncbi:MAG: PEP-utilizing enzyme [Caldimicrobium sp.]|nr:PEP-utilizing enzyme [Caldimicrobium sp.]MCX7873972.1 PEP-utilizing enzyme [Caldimicrobium sp.]MDW8094189.1 PEP/pyruvate-binding domain-containing protein [Caldimicrobium sp.]
MLSKLKIITKKILAKLKNKRVEERDSLTEEVFKKRYQKFLELTTANSMALEVMAELEDISRGNVPPSIDYLRSKCTTLTVNVYRMIKALEALSGRENTELEEIFSSITERLESILSAEKSKTRGVLVMDLAEISEEHFLSTGNKMANLGVIKSKLGYLIPEGFVITTEAFCYFLDYNKLDEEIKRRLTLAGNLDDMELVFKTSASLVNLITKAKFPKDLEFEIIKAIEKLERSYGGELSFAVRSSAVGEDTSQNSFAGLFKTILNVPKDEMLQAIKEVFASKYEPPAIIYRVQRGFRDEELLMSVGCMVMIPAVISGVTFTKDPKDYESSHLEIQAVRGTAENLVQGMVDGEVYILDRESGTLVTEITKDGLLNFEVLQKLWKMSLEIERLFGLPQDIEWCLDAEGKLYILQARPLVFSTKYQRESVEFTAGEEDLKLIAEGGVTVNTGVATGIAHIVKSDLDMLSFPKGGILIAPYALPKWSALLRRASALICERGQAVSHLAIVARELGIPSIFGLEGICHKIPSGAWITVDAIARKVYLGKLSKTEIIQSEQRIYSKISSVNLILHQLLSLIIPLNLTDPESPKFRPKFCTTLHDIVRYCHEKAVEELLHLGDLLQEKDRFAQKMLGEGAPWWIVVDLGGAFQKDQGRFKKKEIKLDIIKSIPLRALWEGLTFVPWEGPPVDLKGLASVIYTSTMRPELDPSMPDHSRAKNYILASKNFCHLGMKLGFHFSVVEANLSEHIIENYIYFYFSGGGADIQRRLLRLEFLRELLERYNFHVMIRMDSLFAHIEKKKREDLIPYLKILGYLLMHLRQLDMIMANPGLVSFFREKFDRELSQIYLAGR